MLMFFYSLLIIYEKALVALELQSKKKFPMHLDTTNFVYYFLLLVRTIFFIVIQSSKLYFL